MSKVSELNKLAKKITGEDPKENTIREILDSISSFFKGSKVKSSNTERAIKNIAENYTSGGGGETATKPVVPSQTEADMSEYLALTFLKSGTDRVSLGDDVLYFYEALDFSHVECFNAMFKNSSITRGPEMDTSNGTEFYEMFSGCEDLVSIPQYDFSNCTAAMGFTDTFKDCASLEDVPNLITKSCNASYLENMFYGCDNLSNDSLNNIMAMCTNCDMSEYKNLAYVGISSSQATICEGLSNYQALLSAGWTTGYEDE